MKLEERIILIYLKHMKIVLFNRDESRWGGGDMIQVRALEKALNLAGHSASYRYDVSFDMSDVDEAWLFHVNYDWTMAHYQKCRQSNKPYRLFAIFYPWHVHNSKEQMRELITNSIVTYALSHQEKQEMIDFIGLNLDEASKIEILSNGYDESIFNRGNGTEERGSGGVIGVGRIESLKRFDLLITSCEQALVPVVICGSDGEAGLRDKLSKIYTRCCISGTRGEEDGALKFTGGISQQELVNYYRSARVCVLTSEGERYGLSLPESIACGCRVVSNPGVRGNEWFPGITVVNQHDTNALAEAIKKEWDLYGTEYTEFKLKTWSDIIKEIFK